MLPGSEGEIKGQQGCMDKQVCLLRFLKNALGVDILLDQEEGEGLPA